MQITLDKRPAAKVEAEALVSYVFEPEKEREEPSKAPSPNSIKPRAARSASWPRPEN